MLSRFPPKENVIAEIGKLLNELCRTDHEARRLTGLVLARWSQWQGPSKLKALFDAEIASQRPRDAQQDGCDKCRDRDGWRQVFVTYEPLPGGGERKQVHYPDGNVVLFEQAL